MPIARYSLDPGSLALLHIGARFVSKAVGGNCPSTPDLTPLRATNTRNAGRAVSDPIRLEATFHAWLPSLFGSVRLFQSNYPTYLASRMPWREAFMATTTQGQCLQSPILQSFAPNSYYIYEEIKRNLFYYYYLPTIHEGPYNNLLYMTRWPESFKMALWDVIEELALFYKTSLNITDPIPDNIPRRLLLAATPAQPEGRANG